MPAWTDALNADPLSWLLEENTPVARHLALRLLLDRPADDPEVQSARAAAMRADPLAAILAAQQPAGYWEKPGPGYATKYRGTVWQLIILDQLGADPADPRVRAACEYVLAHSQAPSGGFGASGRRDEAVSPPSAVIHCLNGNLLRALLGFGYLDAPRLQPAIDWQARAITGEGFEPAQAAAAPPRHGGVLSGERPGASDAVLSGERPSASDAARGPRSTRGDASDPGPRSAPADAGDSGPRSLGRYYATGTSGPGFACAANDKLPCAWGAVKAMLALARVPPERRAPHVRRAVEQGVDFLLSRDPARADYPAGWGSTRPSSTWFKLGTPISYMADVLQNLQALCELGHGADPRLQPALAWLLAKQDRHGRWTNEYGAFTGKTWAELDRPGHPSKLVTLRACHVLKLVAQAGGR